MKYALFIHWNEARAENEPQGHVLEVMQACDAHNQKMEADGERVSGAPLEPTKTAVSVRVRNGETILSDGPFAETKEQLGGFTILDCDSHERAQVLAAEMLEAQKNYDGRIELYELA